MTFPLNCVTKNLELFRFYWDEYLILSTQKKLLKYGRCRNGIPLKQEGLQFVICYEYFYLVIIHQYDNMI